MSKFSFKQEILTWYFNKVKYRKYNPMQRKTLVAFEFGILARQDLDSVIPILMKLNLKRVCALYDEDFATVETLDRSIKSMQTDYDEAIKDLEGMDQTLWRMVFIGFVKTHDDETCNRVWKVPPEELVKLRALLAEKDKKS